MTWPMRFFIVFAGLLLLTVEGLRAYGEDTARIAANTLQIDREAQEVADAIIAAGTDPQARRDAHLKYFAWISRAGFLSDRHLLAAGAWDVIKADFCEMREANEDLRLLFTAVSDAKHLVFLYPDFAKIRHECSRGAEP